MLAEQIAACRCPFVVACSASEALEALHRANTEHDPFEIAVLDHMMPESNGEMLGDAIKSDPELRRTTLVMLDVRGPKGRLRAV